MTEEEIEKEKAAFDRYVEKYGLDRKICDRMPLQAPTEAAGALKWLPRYTPTLKEKNSPVSF